MDGQTLVYGSGGIGKSIAQIIVNQNKRVYLLGHNEKKLLETKKTLGLPLNQILAVSSLVKAEEITKVYNWLKQEKVQISTLVHASGYALPKLTANIELQEWQDVVNVNLNSCFSLYQLANSFFIPQKYDIIFFSSASLNTAWTKNSLYGASKAGLEYMAQSLQQEIKDQGGRVWLYRVGSVDTPFFDNIKSHLPKSKRINPDELAQWVVANLNLPHNLYSPLIQLESH